MSWRARMPLVYSRAERFSDAVVHVTGLFAALLAVPVLVAFSVIWVGDVPVVLAALTYGVCLIAMIACSAVYHMTPAPAWKALLRRFDHSAIYLKIAGTYTPFAVLAGTHTVPLLAGLWGAAFAGISLKLLRDTHSVWLGVVLYLGMGWAGVAFGGEILGALSPAGFALMLAGGLMYSGGIVFFLWERLPFHNTIWHVFVLAATCIFYAAVMVELRSGAARIAEAAAAVASS
jgi:hemolysin III